MTKLLTLLALMIASPAAQSAPIPGLLPDVFNDMPRRMFVPPGFDSNDQAEVVIRGEFRNTCYQVGPSRAHVDADQKRIVIENEAYYYDAFMCMMVLVPYVKAIPIGILGEGTYSVQFAGDSGESRELGSMTIHPSATSGPDDFVYAPVEELRVEPGELGEPHRLTLSGHFTDSCMEVEDVKVLVRTEDVIEILPTVKFATENCRAEKRPFSRTVFIPVNLRGERLVHVRVLNGQSINRVVTF